MKTGVIGLGAMGAPMAVNLHRGGQLCCAWNRTASKAKQLADAHGLVLAGSLHELASQCEVIIISVSRDVDMLAVIDAMIPSLSAGTVVIDTSTVGSDTAITAAQRLTEVEVAFLDAPVSGGIEGASAGTLAMMVGGDAATLARVTPVLNLVANRIVHMGPVGAGQATKAVNQIMAAGINQAVTEALAFGQKMGLNMDRVIEVVGSGAAGNWFLKHRGRTMLQKNFTPGFRVGLHHKDLKLCQMMADRFGVQLPIVEMTLIHYQRLIDAGYSDEDISALYRVKRALLEKTESVTD